jgi:hypothetical protein
MHEALPQTGDAGRKAFNEVLALHGPPAYVRRAQMVEAAWEGVLLRCRRQREEWLALVRTRLAMLRELAGSWDALRAVLDEAAVVALAALDSELRPSLRGPVQASTSVRRLRAAVAELAESMANFNRRWAAFLAQVDLGEVNRARHDYNRYYVLEKECAVRSPAVARQGFRPLAPATLAELEAAFPMLPMVS